ncbi:MAG: NUDIX domain-containing protein [Defluviitaleaceae bacterium]|nr:NUDIX domain-containing protein [Defluviitaleaceae bacterium]
MPEFWDILDKNGNKTGRLHERGHTITNVMKQGEYHLVVHVWIMNRKNEFLISKRTPNKSYPNMWECTGGSAVASDDSATTAVKEVQEELGVILEPQNGQLFKRYIRAYDNGSGDFVDVWLFRQDINLSTIRFQVNETCDAVFADKSKIEQMIADGTFIGREIFPYLDDLFCFSNGKF